MKRPLWQLSPPISSRDYLSLREYPLLLAQLLYNRDIRDRSAADSFLTPEAAPFGNPLLLPDMPQALERVLKAIRSGEKIAVYGDFDADGITATAILCLTISSLGGQVEPYIPHRFTEGYGVNSEAMRALREGGTDLVITVDCGTSSLKEIAYARSIGLDVIITDHHTLPAELPPASAIINIQRLDHQYPFSGLCGAGVAFKMAQGLLSLAGGRSSLDPEELLDLAAIGTVADMAPLLGENRCIVKRGLELMNKRPRTGLMALLEQARAPLGGVDSYHIGYVISPRLNAMGRLDHAIHSYKLLTTDSPLEAVYLAGVLEEMNRERQRITQEALDKARARLEAKGVVPGPLVLVSDPDFNAGVVGLVATKLAEEWYCPAIVVEEGPERSRGSCRSIPQFNIVQALAECKDLFTQYGGHPQAAGFTIPTGKLPELEERLTKIAVTKLGHQDLNPALKIDAPLPLTAIPGDTLQQIERLGPFGQENPEPLFMARRLALVDARPLGKDGSHLMLKLKDSGMVWSATAFGMGNRLSELAELKPYLVEGRPTRLIDVVYSLQIDRWGHGPPAEDGQELLRLNIRDFRAFEPGPL